MEISTVLRAGRLAAVAAIARQVHETRTHALAGRHPVEGRRRRTLTGGRGGRFGGLRRSRGHRAFGRRLGHDHAAEGVRP